MSILKSVDGNRITLESGATVSFAFPVADAMEFGDVLVVRLTIPRGVIFNENVYGVAPDGKIIWQIRPEYPPDYNAAWGGLENRDGWAVLSNSESQIRYVDPKTGTITKAGMSVR
jgi:hypothetical protein